VRPEDIQSTKKPTIEKKAGAKASKKPAWSWPNFLLYRSALQKAIRWCEVNDARYFAQVLTGMGKPGTNFNTLLTIAAEDVGLADPTLITYVRKRAKRFKTLFKRKNVKATDTKLHSYR